MTTDKIVSLVGIVLVVVLGLDVIALELEMRVFRVGDQGRHKNSGSHIDASHSRQPLVKGERLVRYEVNAVILGNDDLCKHVSKKYVSL